ATGRDGVQEAVRRWNVVTDIALDLESEASAQERVVKRVLAVEQDRRCAQDGWQGQTIREMLGCECSFSDTAVFHGSQRLGKKALGRIRLGGHASDHLAARQACERVILIVA